MGTVFSLWSSCSFTGCMNRNKYSGLCRFGTHKQCAIIRTVRLKMTHSIMWRKYSSKSTVSCHVKGVIRGVDQNPSHIPPADGFLRVQGRKTFCLSVKLGLKSTDIIAFTEDPSTLGITVLLSLLCSCSVVVNLLYNIIILFMENKFKFDFYPKDSINTFLHEVVVYDFNPDMQPS